MHVQERKRVEAVEINCLRSGLNEIYVFVDQGDESTAAVAVGDSL